MATRYVPPGEQLSFHVNRLRRVSTIGELGNALTNAHAFYTRGRGGLDLADWKQFENLLRVAKERMVQLQRATPPEVPLTNEERIRMDTSTPGEQGHVVARLYSALRQNRERLEAYPQDRDARKQAEEILRVCDLLLANVEERFPLQGRISPTSDVVDVWDSFFEELNKTRDRMGLPPHPETPGLDDSEEDGDWWKLPAIVVGAIGGIWLLSKLGSTPRRV